MTPGKGWAWHLGRAVGVLLVGCLLAAALLVVILLVKAVVS